MAGLIVNPVNAATQVRLDATWWNGYFCYLLAACSAWGLAVLLYVGFQIIYVYPRQEILIDAYDSTAALAPFLSWGFPIGLAAGLCLATMTTIRRTWRWYFWLALAGFALIAFGIVFQTAYLWRSGAWGEISPTWWWSDAVQS
jgi:hypothetical protein